MRFDPAYTLEAMPRLLEGALVTVQVAGLGFVLSLSLATLLFVLKTTLASRLLDAVLAVYVSFVRGTPLLIQIFLVYYVLPVVGVDLGPVTAGVLAITLNSAAYVLEILRGGLASVPKGHLEAARALGVGTPVLWWKVILPQIYINSIPPLVNEFTLVVKSTPLLSVITVVELMRVSQQIYSSNYHPVEILSGAFVLYFLICFAVSRLSVRLEQHFSLRRA